MTLSNVKKLHENPSKGFGADRPPKMAFTIDFILSFYLNINPCNNKYFVNIKHIYHNDKQLYISEPEYENEDGARIARVLERLNPLRSLE